MTDATDLDEAAPKPANDDLFEMFGDLLAFRPEGFGLRSAGRRADRAAERERIDAMSIAAE